MTEKFFVPHRPHVDITKTDLCDHCGKSEKERWRIGFNRKKVYLCESCMSELYETMEKWKKEYYR